MYRVLIGRFTGSPALQALYRVPLAREHDELERKRCKWEMCSLAWKWAAIYFIQTVTEWRISQLVYSDFSIAVLWHIKVSSRVKNHHFSRFAIFWRLNKAHQELSFKKNSRKKCFSCAGLRSAKVWQLIKAGYEFFLESLTWNTFWNNLLIPGLSCSKAG